MTDTHVKDNHAHAGHAGEHPENHEHTDVPIKALIYFGIGLIVFSGLIYLALYLTFWAMEDYHAAKDKPLSGVDTHSTVPTPTLQGVPGYYANTPKEDMAELAKKQKEELTTAAPSRVPGYYRVPIEQAKEMYLNQAQAPATQPVR